MTWPALHRFLALNGIDDQLIVIKPDQARHVMNGGETIGINFHLMVMQSRHQIRCHSTINCPAFIGRQKINITPAHGRSLGPMDCKDKPCNDERGRTVNVFVTTTCRHPTLPNPVIPRPSHSVIPRLVLGIQGAKFAKKACTRLSKRSSPRNP